MGKRRLTDLYLVGRQESFDDGGGEPVAVWLQKLNSLEQIDAAQAADGQRSVVIAAIRDHDSDLWKQAWTEADRLEGTKELVEYLTVEDEAREQMAQEARLEAEDEWTKDSYLDGLRRAWNEDGLRERYQEDPEDADARRVWTELQRFNDTVREAVEDRMAPLRKEYEDMPVEVLKQKVAERLLEVIARQRWIKEFYRQQIFIGVRDPENHRQRYFDTLEEIDILADPMRRKLEMLFDALNVDAMEGKGSPVSPSSSQPSEQPELVATGAGSGPGEQTG